MKNWYTNRDYYHYHIDYDSSKHDQTDHNKIDQNQSNLDQTKKMDVIKTKAIIIIFVSIGWLLWKPNQT